MYCYYYGYCLDDVMMGECDDVLEPSGELFQSTCIHTPLLSVCIYPHPYYCL